MEQVNAILAKIKDLFCSVPACMEIQQFGTLKLATLILVLPAVFAEIFAPNKSSHDMLILVH